MPQNFKTQDYGLATWLVFNSIELLGTVEYPPETRKSFVFVWSDRIPVLEEQWGPPRSTPNSEPAKTCKKLFSSHTIVKNALKESLNAADL